MKAHVVKFLQFLEDKEGKNVPLLVKLLNQDKFTFTKNELIVKGDLNLADTNVTSLPDGLQVDWNLNLTGCAYLDVLPNELKVGGVLYLIGCTSLKSLPLGLKIGGSLYLRKTSLAELYNADEIRAMIEAKGGYVKWSIYV